VHKWFARRPGSLFRALALAELGGLDSQHHLHRSNALEGICLDPLMGGGTPLLEAARLGMPVIGYDTNALAVWVVARELEGLDADSFADAAERTIARAHQSLLGLHDTNCVSCAQAVPARYFVWTRAHRCVCGLRRALLSDTLIGSPKLGRHPREVHLCAHCLALHECEPGEDRPADCASCDQPYDRHLTPPGSAAVCDCGEPYRIPPHGELSTPDQLLACVVYNCPDCDDPSVKRFKPPDSADHDRVKLAAQRAAKGHASWPTELIPAASETRRLRRWGYQQWRDLHLDRQLVSLGALADAVCAEPDAALRRALVTCLSDLLRFQNVLCRYDRQAHKPTDIFAVHGFPVPRVICEAHPLGDIAVGSGGFTHIARKYERAKRWCAAPHETRVDARGKLHRHVVEDETLAAALVDGLPRAGQASVRCGSIVDDPLPAGSVDLVMTDPPYFANVQYAQLADFHHVWLKRLDATHPDSVSTVTDRDAVGSDIVGLDEFARRLSAVYVAAGRALRDGGAFCFTYHHNDLAAYAPVVMACLDAGLAVSAGYACPTEVRASQHIHGRNASTVDVVFVLRKSGAALAAPDDFGAGWVAGRVRALRTAGVKLTDADRACLLHSAAALGAIAALRDGWDVEASDEHRYEAARVAIGLHARLPAAV
jgi:hypothetical protein